MVQIYLHNTMGFILAGHHYLGDPFLLHALLDACEFMLEVLLGGIVANLELFRWLGDNINNNIN